MSKKFIIIVLLAILLTATVSSTTIAETSSDENPSLGFAIVKSEIAIDVGSQIDNPIGPSETKEIEITISYRLDIGDLAARLFFNRRIGRFLLFGFGYIMKSKEIPSAEINFSVECPDWCTVTLEPSGVTAEISNVFKEADEKVKLTISVNDTAPALELGNITVTAESQNSWGIGGSSNKTTISVMAAYNSTLEINATATREISPVNETVIPINITNAGNGETTVNISIETAPEKWNISFSQAEVTLSVGETKQIDVFVIPVKSFKNETIQLAFTPTSTSDEDVDEKYLQGESVAFGIALLNDGSLDEENGIPGFEILLVVIAFLVVVVICFFVIRRRKQ
jgi:hypothetical protein